MIFTNVLTVNVCIHDFDDVKRRIKQGSEESNKAHFASRLIQDCFNKQSLDSRFLQDQALPHNERFQVIQGTCNRLPIHVIDYQWFESV